MNILITGGCGFIGTNLVFYLTRNHPEYHITVYDAFTYAGDKSNLKPLISNKTITQLGGDICDHSKVDRVLGYGIDLVVNLAAETHVDRSIIDPGEFVRTNVYGVQVLLDCCRTRMIPVLHISTDEVYGPVVGDETYGENSPLKPTSPYAASKAGADMLVNAAYRTFGQEVMVLRPVNNMGPYQYPEKIIPLFVDRLKSNKTVPVYGDGLQSRNWLYVDDFCSAIELAMNNFSPGEFFNVAGNNEIDNLELTKRLLKFFGRSEDRIKHIKDRPGHDRRYSIDASKFINRFGWLPKYDIEAALKKTVNWYIDNDEWLERKKTRQFNRYIERQYGNI